MNLDGSKYYLEAARLTDDELRDEPLLYSEAAGDELLSVGPDDAFEDIVKEFREQEAKSQAQENLEKLGKVVQLHHFAPTVDEFFRSYLLRNEFMDTLNAFQIEWFRKLHKGQLDVNSLDSTPHIYEQNEQLSNNLTRLENENKALRAKLDASEESRKKIRNERDYHMLKHRRLTQEKDQLIGEIKKMRTHYAEYEPMLRQLHHKYEMAMKEKTLNRVERDRAIGQAEGLRSALVSFQKLGLNTDETAAEQARGKCSPVLSSVDPMSGVKSQARNSVNLMRKSFGGLLTEMPPDRKINPLLNRIKRGSPTLTRLVSRKLNEKVRAHDSACTSVIVHTEQPWLCTTGDDKSWKLWSLNGMTLIGQKMDAHDSWIASADFQPKGNLLSTAGGDGTIRIWQIETNPDTLPVDDTESFPSKTKLKEKTIINAPKQLATLKHHTGAVWSVNWHWDGRFLASAGLDNTVCLWDVAAAQQCTRTQTNACRVTLRKHGGSVNSVRFLPYGNILVTASTDKAVLLWDARTGISVHSFLGHQSSVSYAVFNQQGTYVASCDSSGVVRFWDLRQASATASFPLPTEELDDSSFTCASSLLDLAKGRKKRLHLNVNQIAYDLSGDYLAAACSDGRVCYVEVPTGQITSLYGHEDAVQSIAFDWNTEFLYSVANDGQVCSWN
ncbi:Sperm-associated antigen 16 protein [Fasciolopsis buskii]|uniref:Sperm-associated antigen 16 protein n=1 Tax=Fasciolopsis buskii TaxID=27845 RepID=A0A8E0RKZ7_9TREM|nr:Sperm-associated antigen 16 protein [Fasciolopsis buski]